MHSDYCNAVLYGTSVTNIRKLQRVQNSIARVVTGSRRRDHITPVLANLHWLPVHLRIEYKLTLLAFKSMTTQQPRYLYELLRRSLRPTETTSSTWDELVTRQQDEPELRQTCLLSRCPHSLE